MALVRRLPAVEALGSVTYICSDKTGTLTQDRMQVERVVAPDGRRWPGGSGDNSEPWSSLFTGLALNNDVEERPDGTLLGEPMEIAIRNAAAAAGFARRKSGGAAARVYELPFDSERKLMTTFHPADSGYMAYTKGAPEYVVARCNSATGIGAGAAYDQEQALAIAREMASQGLRVLAIAQRKWPELPAGATADRIEQAMTLLGFVGLIDPPRTEAAQSVAACRKAGISPVMITGDHPDTAKAIAAALGILDRHGRVVSGAELSRMPDRELADIVGQIRVYARVDPGQKIRIVRALQAQGEFVAMTGDGVNDAPALQQANVGVAMGKSGTDVAREAASLVLLDDDFSTIVAAIREGRRIFDNVRKFIKFLLTGNSAEIWTIFLAPILGLPMPLLPIQILWINLLTDGLPALALSAERAEPDTMSRPPRKPSEGILAGGLWQHVLWVGLLIGGVSLLCQALAIQWGSPNWQTMIFTVLVLSQLGHVLAVRSSRVSVFTQGLLSNKPVLFAVLITTALQLAVIYLPALNVVFNTAPLTMAELGLCLALSAIAFIAVEAEKTFVRWGYLRRN
jgi:Ca2+-transporting ATPase